MLKTTVKLNMSKQLAPMLPNEYMGSDFACAKWDKRAKRERSAR